MLEEVDWAHAEMCLGQGDWGWASLPPELLEAVMDVLPPGDVAGARQTCRAWRDTARHKERRLRPKALSPQLPVCFPRVQALNLRGCREPKQEELAALGRLSGLRSLAMQLNDCSTTSALTAQLEQLPLSALDLSGSLQINNCVISSISRMTRLQSLKLDDVRVVADSVGLQALSALTQLQELSITVPQSRLQAPKVDNALAVDDAACAMFVGRMCRLHTLDLSGQRHISTAALARLPGLPELRKLALGSCPALCEDGYRIIACLTCLTELRLDCGGAKTGVVHAPDMPPKRGVLRCVAALPNLGKLQLRGLSEEDGCADVQSFIDLSALTHLSLSGCRSASGADSLDALLSGVPMANLHELELTGCHVIQAHHMKSISGAMQLRALDLSDTPVLPESLHFLSGLSNLESLRMDNSLAWGAGYTQTGVFQAAFLAALPSLRQLSAVARGGEYEAAAGGASALLESVLAHGSALPKLQRLNLSRHGMPAGGDALVRLSQLSALTDLDLSASTAADEHMRQLSALTQLQRLDLSSTAVTSEGIGLLCCGDTPLNLRSINLCSTSIDDGAVSYLARLPHLACVHLSDQPHLSDISDAGLAEMTKLPALKTLEVRGNCVITAAGLKALSRLPELAELDVRGCAHVQPSKALPNLQGASSLRSLKIGDYQGLSYIEAGREPDSVSPTALAAFRAGNKPFLHTLQIPPHQVREPKEAGWGPPLLLLLSCLALWLLLPLFASVVLHKDAATLGFGGLLQLCGLGLSITAALEGFRAGRRSARAPSRVPTGERVAQWAEDCLVWLLMTWPCVKDCFLAASDSFFAVSSGFVAASNGALAAAAATGRLRRKCSLCKIFSVGLIEGM